jgi:hypothetical protein
MRFAVVVRVYTPEARRCMYRAARVHGITKMDAQET